MTEPATLPNDDAETIRSGGHNGVVYVHNPLSGEVSEHTPEEAATLVYNRGWQPVSKDDATRIDAHQILKDSIGADQAIGLGLTRGVTGGLSDLLPSSPDENRLDAAIGEAHPWLTPIAEGAGMFAPLGVGAGLSEAGHAITTGLRGGEELGILGKAATRAAGMGAEGAAYGGIGAARESQLQDDPLTAQKLLSGMFGGGIVGGALGGGIGALEGSGSLIRGMFKSSGPAREELAASGLKDADVSPIMERAGIGPLEPGALQQLQAHLYNDPNITPEFLAAMNKSPGIRDDVMIAAGPQRAEAEANFAKALNDLHNGNQDALAGWQGRLKRGKVEQWIGPESEHVSDSGRFGEFLQMLDVPGRFNLAQDIVEAVDKAGASNPEAFSELMNSVSAGNKEEALRNIDRALLHGDKDVLDQLFSSKLLNDESVAKLRVTNPGDVSPDRLLEALDAKGSQDALRKALKLPDRIEPTWKQEALGFIDKQNALLSELAAQPKGYIAGEGGGQIKKLSELMNGARKSIEEGDRANAFSELDYVKKRVGAVRAEAGDRIGTGQAIAGHAGNMQAEAKALLERADVWGDKAAAAQKEMNQLIHEHLNRSSDFKSAFFSESGRPDPKNPWAGELVADPAKIRGVMDRLVNPERSIELQKFKAAIADSNRMADVMEKYYQPDEAQKGVIASMRDGSKVANDSMDKALHFALRANQGKILSAVAHGGARGMAGGIAAYALGGPLGLAGAVVGRALMNPGRMWRMQAIVERMLGSHGGRVADGLANVMGKATRLAGDVAQKSTRVVGSAALLTQNVEARQKAYGDTLHDLAAMASNRDAVVKSIASWHGPDLAHMPNAIPAMTDAIQRGAQFCLQVAPSRPRPGMFSDDQLGLISDKEAQEFSNTVHAAMDPATLFECIKKGELTPQVLKAAETASPELVQDMRNQAMQMLSTTTGAVNIGDVEKSGLSLLLGAPASPVYTGAIQAAWQSSKTSPTKKITPGNMGDTGVNDRYAQATYSAADRLESGEHPL